MLASTFPECIVEIRMSTRLGNTLEAVMVQQLEACGNQVPFACLFIVLGVCLYMVLKFRDRHVCIALIAGTNMHLVQHATRQAEAAMTLRYGPMTDAQKEQAKRQVMAHVINLQYG